MNKGLRLLALLLSFSLLLTGCSASQSSGVKEIAPRTIQLVVEVNSPPAVYDCATFFGETLSQLSGGQLSAEISYCADPTAELESNFGKVYFTSGDCARRVNPAMVALELPYLFVDDKAANDFLSTPFLLEFFSSEESSIPSAICLGASVAGNRYFVTTPGAEKGGALSLHYPYYNISAIINMDSDVRTFDNWDTPFMDMTHTAYEMPLWYLAQRDAQMLTISTVPHSYDTMWIVSDQKLLSMLSPHETALLKESAVRTCGYALTSSRKLDKEFTASLQSSGIGFTDEVMFPKLREMDVSFNTQFSNLNDDILTAAMPYSES